MTVRRDDDPTRLAAALAERLASLLAFDTSTDETHVVLVARGQSWTRTAAGGAQASSLLIPLINALLAEAGLGFQSLDAIGFGRGPGAFTGLRTACSVAQGLAFALGIPVLPLDTLMLVAEDASQRIDARRIWVAADARIGEVYAGGYERSGETWRVVSEPALYAPEALAALWLDALPEAVAGSALDVHADRLPLPAGAQRVPEARPRAGALAALAQAAWAAGAAVAAPDALPLYLRDKVAFTTAERASQRAAVAAL